MGVNGRQVEQGEGDGAQGKGEIRQGDKKRVGERRRGGERGETA